jgi:hypothetical protein
MRVYLLVLAVSLITLLAACGKETKKNTVPPDNAITFYISGKIPMPQDDLVPETVFPFYPDPRAKGCSR